MANGATPAIAPVGSGQPLPNAGPPRNGMDRRTGKLLSGWPHVKQSIDVIFATPFHSRVLRRWVGSFVPHILGNNFTYETITRFFWAISSALDLWEPDYRLSNVFLEGPAISSGVYLPPGAVEGQLRAGRAIFREEGVYYPRAHLGDFTPATSQVIYTNPVNVSNSTQN